MDSPGLKRSKETDVEQKSITPATDLLTALENRIKVLQGEIAQLKQQRDLSRLDDSDGVPQTEPHNQTSGGRKVLSASIAASSSPSGVVDHALDIQTSGALPVQQDDRADGPSTDPDRRESSPRRLHLRTQSNRNTGTSVVTPNVSRDCSYSGRLGWVASLSPSDVLAGQWRRQRALYPPQPWIEDVPQSADDSIGPGLNREPSSNAAASKYVPLFVSARNRTKLYVNPTAMDLTATNDKEQDTLPMHLQNNSLHETYVPKEDSNAPPTLDVGGTTILSTDGRHLSLLAHAANSSESRSQVDLDETGLRKSSGAGSGSENIPEWDDQWAGDLEDDESDDDSSDVSSVFSHGSTASTRTARYFLDDVPALTPADSSIAKQEVKDALVASKHFEAGEDETIREAMEDYQIEGDQEDAKSIYSYEHATSSSISATTSSDIDAMVNLAVNTLFWTTELQPLYAALMEDTAVASEKFLQSMPRLIRRLGSAVKSQAALADDKYASNLLRRRLISSRIVSDIANKLSSASGCDQSAVERWLRPGQPSQRRHDRSQPNGDDDKDDLPTELIDRTLATLERLRNGPAYSSFKTKVFDLAHAPYARRVLQTLQNSGDDRVQDTIHRYGRELSFVPTNLFDFHSKRDLSIAKLVTGFCAGSPRKVLTRWHLYMQKGLLPAHFVRVQWRTPCGNVRSVDLPRSMAEAFQEVLTTAPEFINRIDCRFASGQSKKCAHTPNGSNVATAATGSGQATAPPPGQPHQRQGTGQPPVVASNARLDVQPGAGHSTTMDSTQSAVPCHLYLCIKTGTAHTFSKLKIDAVDTDITVFAALKNTYLNSRKDVLSRLSWWRYSHCDFYRLVKYPPRGSPHEEGYPSEDDGDYNEYDFQPRPVKPMPPIGKEEFADRFYTYCQECRHWWHAEQRRAWALCTQDRDAIPLLPKKKTPLELQDRKREEFWGLYIRERRSDMVVCIYILLANLPGVIFFFLWLFQWSHASSLSDAVVPLTVSATLTIGAATCIFVTDSIR